MQFAQNIENASHVVLRGERFRVFRVFPCHYNAVHILVSVAALRVTRHSVNADLAFGEGHENRQESIFKMIDGLFRGHLQHLAQSCKGVLQYP